MKSTLILTLTVSALAFPAFAGNAVYEAPVEAVVIAPAVVPAAPVNDWAGPYVGGQVGYLTGTGVFNNDGDYEIGASGMIYGVHAGYNFGMGSWIGGVEVDYYMGDVEFDEEIEGETGTINKLSHLKLRGGRAMGQTLIYGTVGMAWATAEFVGDDYSDQGNFWGLGAEFMMTQNISAGVEYLRHNFDDFDNTGVDIEANTLSARASYHF